MSLGLGCEEYIPFIYFYRNIDFSKALHSILTWIFFYLKAAISKIYEFSEKIIVPGEVSQLFIGSVGSRVCLVGT